VTGDFLISRSEIQSMRASTNTVLFAAVGLVLAGCGGSNDIKAKIDPNSLPSSARIYVPGMT
jgi:hypothetical protein